MQAILPVLVTLLLMIGLLGMLIGVGSRLLKTLLGIIVILILLSVFADPILAFLGPAFSTLITWAIRIAAVIAALYGIGAIIRILVNR
jgi:hypothetical protein